MDVRCNISQMINWLVLKIPFCFTKRMVSIANHFFDRKETTYLKHAEEVKTYSLLDPRLNWKMKAISSVCSISAEQVNRVYKWQKQTDLHHSKSKNKVTINDNGWMNIGDFKTNIKHDTFQYISLGKKSDYIDRCNVHLFTYSNGTYYLSIYWYLTDKATCLVKDIDISQFKNTKLKYSTCNPLSRFYGLATHINKISQGDKVIINGLKTIDKEIERLEQRLKKIISVKSSSISVRNLDILVQENESYFLNVDDLEKNNSNELNSKYRLDEVVLNRHLPSPMFITYSCNEKKEFLINTICNMQDLPFGQVFIKSEKLTQEEIDNPYYHTYEYMTCHISDSHNAFAIFQLFNQKFNQLNNKYADFILNNNTEPEKQYDVMYRAFIEISELERQMKSTSRLNFDNNEASYMDDLYKDCSSALVKVSEVKKDIEQKKKNSNELVQAGNLKYQKRMSQLVICLAIIQILIAYLSLDDTTMKKQITPETIFAVAIILIICVIYHPVRITIKWIKKHL